MPVLMLAPCVADTGWPIPCVGPWGPCDPRHRSSRAKVAVKVRAGNEAGEDVASLTDPLLLGEEGKADGGSS